MLRLLRKMKNNMSGYNEVYHGNQGQFSTDIDGFSM